LELLAAGVDAELVLGLGVEMGVGVVVRGLDPNRFIYIKSTSLGCATAYRIPRSKTLKN
jgi:hypothetical protein